MYLPSALNQIIMDTNRISVQSHKPMEEMSEQELLVLLVID